MIIDGIEFYTIDGDVWYFTSDGRNEKLEESDKDIITMLIDRIMECYPKAYKVLSDYYQKVSMNVSRYRFLIARRFCKCNFGKLDTTEKDFDSSLSFYFEKVDCPLRGECKLEGVVCMPEFNSSLSKKELEVMRLIYDGCSKEEVADRMYLSPFTVKNHIKSVYSKLGIHEKSEFIQYANKNHLFS